MTPADARIKGPGTNAVTFTIDFTSTDPETGHEFNIASTVTVLITPTP